MEAFAVATAELHPMSSLGENMMADSVGLGLAQSDAVDDVMLVDHEQHPAVAAVAMGNHDVGNVADAQSRRKRKRQDMEEDAPSVQWAVSIPNPGNFTHLVKMIESVMPEAFMKVVNTKNFTGVGFESVDAAGICYAIARLGCDSQIAPGCDTNRQWSCVNMSWLRLFSESAPPNSEVSIVSISNSDDLLLVANEIGANGRRIECEMHKIGKEPEAGRLPNFDYRFVIEFSVTDLKNIVAAGKSAKADNLKFSILTPAEGSGLPSNANYLSISFESPMGYMMWIFANSDDSSKTAPGSSSAKKSSSAADAGAAAAAPARQVSNIDRSLLAEQFNIEFSIKYLTSIVGSMARRTVTLRLSAKTPLELEYQLGDGASWIKWVLAPRLDE